MATKLINKCSVTHSASQRKKINVELSQKITDLIGSVSALDDPRTTHSSPLVATHAATATQGIDSVDVKDAETEERGPQQRRRTISAFSTTPAPKRTKEKDEWKSTVGVFSGDLIMKEISDATLKVRGRQRDN
jgi:hypothetical protein